MSTTPCSWYGITCAGTTTLNVTELNLNDNGLTGTLTPELVNLNQLLQLELGINAFPGSGLTGPIPPEFGQFANLQVLGLARNGLSGGLPPELGQISSLQDMSLWANNLTGPIPPELSQLTNLKSLVL